MGIRAWGDPAADHPTNNHGSERATICGRPNTSTPGRDPVADHPANDHGSERAAICGCHDTSTPDGDPAVDHPANDRYAGASKYD